MNHEYRKTVLLCVILFLCLPIAESFSQQRSNASQHNIILIMADDLGYGDLGSYGQEMIETPHIDALAAAGMRFINFYSGSTVCAPSREALLTGMTTGHTFIRGNFLTDEAEDPPMPHDKVTIAELLKKAGYTTGLYGKWGLGGEDHGPDLQGFDSSFCYLDNRALRYGQWKGVQNQLYKTPNAPIELYDLSVDIGEENDVAKEHPDLIREITEIFAKASSNDAPFFPYAPDSKAKLHVMNIESPADMKDFFRYSTDGIPLVSSHRGAPALGYPENSLATFIHTLRHTWSIMEIDPHYTKDSAIVLMHDPTLDRTSTGEGKVSDYTLEELKKFNLKDVHGKVTKYKIPTLDQALEWAKGKTVLIIDRKDVPAEERARKIIVHQAQTCAMVMCYTYEDAKKVYTLDENIMMEVFIPDRASAEKFEKTGVPWSNIVAFVTHDEVKDPGIMDFLHSKGVMAIRGSSRNIDKQYSNDQISKKELLEGYRKLIEAGTNIIEADLGVQAGKELMKEEHQKSSKSKYFGYR